MLAATIIVFREVIEAGLIVGIVMAVTRGIPGRGRFVAGGVAGGVLGACLFAIFAGTISAAFAGSGQEVFNALILAVAVFMLAWHNIWMARHGRELAMEMKAVGKAVLEGSRPLIALAVVVGVAVLREGFEVVLFLYGILIADGGSGWGLFSGGMLGLLLGGAVSALTFAGLVKIPPRHVFGVTSLLITFLAAGMAAQSAGFLEQAGILTLFSSTLWDTSALLPEKSILGRVLHSLIGYADQPSEMQAIVYVTVLASIFTLTRLFAPSNTPVRSGSLAGSAAPNRVAA